MTDLLGGQVQLMFSDGPTALPQIKGGRFARSRSAARKRSALAPMSDDGGGRPCRL
jgi:tripartite-type tricarboxylate transporter receptor subunit TctC